jgi:hypothetical protein
MVGAAACPIGVPPDQHPTITPSGPAFPARRFLGEILRREPPIFSYPLWKVRRLVNWTATEFTILKRVSVMAMQSMMDRAESSMTANISSLTGTILATIAALLTGAEGTSAAERVATGDSSSCLQNPCPPDSGPREFGSGTTPIVSDDTTSRYVALIQHKSMALDLPRDVSDVFIGNIKIANVVLRSKRRAYVIATGPGQTNVFFYDAKGQQIDGLDVNVADHKIDEKIPAREISVLRGATGPLVIYECTPMCSLQENAVADKPLPNFVVIPTVPVASQ